MKEIISAPLSLHWTFGAKTDWAIADSQPITEEEARPYHEEFGQFVSNLNAGKLDALSNCVVTEENPRESIERLCSMVANLSGISELYCVGAVSFSDGAIGLMYTYQSDYLVLVAILPKEGVRDVVVTWVEQDRIQDGLTT